MKWKRPSEKMIGFFDAILPGGSKVERKKMFGCPVGFINGNMFMGLHNDRIILRLGEKERENLIREHNTQIFEPTAGRKMREYIVVPENLLTNVPTLKAWCEVSYEYASKLKPKEKKAKSKVAKK